MEKSLPKSGTYGKMVFVADNAGVSEWQTMQTQNLLRVTACGFKSRRRQDKKS